jgi:hypothetical protein
MKLTFVENMPTKRMIKHHDLQELIKQFANSDHKVAKVDFTEEDYVNAKSCANSLRVTLSKSKRPITVFQRGNEVYLAKKYL